MNVPDIVLFATKWDAKSGHYYLQPAHPFTFSEIDSPRHEPRQAQLRFCITPLAYIQNIAHDQAMSKLWRALLISAVATGTAAVIMKLIEPEKPLSAPTPPAHQGPYVDADAMPQEQQDLLMQELASQL